MLSLTWPEALAWRLGRHLLDPVGAGTTADVVGRLGAVAAQLDPASAELGVRVRRTASRPGEVAAALAEGVVVATFAFRGAVHLMTPSAAADALALRAASRMWERPAWRSTYRLEPEDWPDLRAAVRDALADGPLTRTELAAALAPHPRFGHLAAAVSEPTATLLKPLAWQGDVCLGAPRGGQLTLQRLDANPRWPGLPDVDEAGVRSVEGYLRAYGPATEDNLHHWLGEGLGVRRTRIAAWLGRLGDRVATVDVEGETRQVLREDLDDLRSARPGGAVRLLPRYDQWVLGPGTADRRVVPADVRPEVSRGADLVVVDGVVAGTWTRGADGPVLRRRPAAAVPPDDVVAAEITRVGELLRP